MTLVPALVILRGNSASDKSTIARRVQRELPRGRVAVIGQDHVRRELLREHDSGPGDTISLAEVMVRHCLARGRITVFEGIFKSARYQQMCERLIIGHDGPSLVCYLDVSLPDVSLPETLRRHPLKPIADHVSDEQVASWYAPNDVLALPGEVMLDERHSEDELVAPILSDLEGLAP